MEADWSQITGVSFYVAEGWYQDGDAVDFYVDDLCLVRRTTPVISAVSTTARTSPRGKALCERRAKRTALGRGDLRRIVRSGVLGRTRGIVTDTWFGRTSTTVTSGEEHRCSRTWRNGLRFDGAC
jgi:hypothetical protein